MDPINLPIGYFLLGTTIGFIVGIKSQINYIRKTESQEAPTPRETNITISRQDLHEWIMANPQIAKQVLEKHIEKANRRKLTWSK